MQLADEKDYFFKEIKKADKGLEEAQERRENLMTKVELLRTRQQELQIKRAVLEQRVNEKMAHKAEIFMKFQAIDEQIDFLNGQTRLKLADVANVQDTPD